MVNVIQYTGEFVSLEMSSRPLDGVTDLWLRKNPSHSHDDEGNDIYTAEEAYMQIDIAEAPDRATVEANFDLWYDTAAAWSDSGDDSDIIKRLSAAEAKNAELTSIIYSLMGVKIDA